MWGHRNDKLMHLSCCSLHVFQQGISGIFSFFPLFIITYT